GITGIPARYAEAGIVAGSPAALIVTATGPGPVQWAARVSTGSGIEEAIAFEGVALAGRAALTQVPVGYAFVGAVIAVTEGAGAVQLIATMVACGVGTGGAGKD